MGNDFMGRILGNILGGSRAHQQSPMAGPGGLGDLLGGVLGRGGLPMGRGSPLGGSRGALLAMLLPLAMQWVQRNGGIGAVVDRFRRQGYGAQANSWVSTGRNEPLASQQVRELVGGEELLQLAQQLGVEEQEVASGFAEILPQVVDHATPQGYVAPDADQVLDQGRMSLEQALDQLRMH
ncbi:YidB family protein [Ramlibacter sp.]|uniref:YidB family protein n=1 Tax=Ramlibacter sp. TaxID=1917967 RepID=UPI002B71EA03|nr:YidB family protein [Ramlibacter sp.]HWI81318.1 YidB family protein [Ramlibacter sp.]